MRLRASQVSSLIESGHSNFPYRPPQSDKELGTLDLTEQEVAALMLLGEIDKKFHVRLRSGNRLGCCGDCEQWNFENWVSVVDELLHGRTTKVWSFLQGAAEFSRFLSKRGYHTKTVHDLVIHLLSFWNKAASILSEKPDGYYSQKYSESGRLRHLARPA